MAKITDFRSITADKPGELISVDIWGPLPSSRKFRNGERKTGISD